MGDPIPIFFDLLGLPYGIRVGNRLKEIEHVIISPIVHFLLEVRRKAMVEWRGGGVERFCTFRPQMIAQLALEHNP